MNAKHDKPTLSLRIAAVLFVLTLLSLCINAGLYARYTVTGRASDSARVAAFSIRPGESYTSPEILFSDMAPGESKVYNFSLTSDSEVAVKYSASLSSTGNLPLTFSINSNTASTGGTSAGACTLTPNQETPVELLTLAPNTGTVDLTLTASWPAGENSLSYLSEIDALRLTITAVQVD